MLTIDYQTPSLDLRTVMDADLLLSCRSISSNKRVDEHVLGGRTNGNAGRFAGEIDGMLAGGD